MVLGKGYKNRMLAVAEIQDIVARAMEGSRLDGKRVLLVVPDNTRTAPIDVMFKALYSQLADRTAALDVLVALGTHPPMAMEQIYERVGITAAEHEKSYPKTRFFNHLWKDKDSLALVGVIPPEKIAEISGGLFSMSVNLTVNKMVLDYDHIMIVGPVFPHEVVGFSGGNKYLFPGISGQESGLRSDR
jgi:nickel-dependent lactate racemase